MTWVCWKMAHRTVRCTRAIHSEEVTLGNSRAPSAKNHQTVWCASGATTTCANGRLWQQEQCGTVPCRSQSSGVRGAPDYPVWHRTVRCRKRTKPPTVDQLRTLTVGWHGSAPDIAQTVRWRTGLSGAPIANSLGQRLPRWLGAINTPNHHNLWHPSIPNISFNTRARDSTSRHIK
jgi:hypothetical protein